MDLLSEQQRQQFLNQFVAAASQLTPALQTQTANQHSTGIRESESVFNSLVGGQQSSTDTDDDEPAEPQQHSPTESDAASSDRQQPLTGGALSSADGRSETSSTSHVSPQSHQLVIAGQEEPDKHSDIAQDLRVPKRRAAHSCKKELTEPESQLICPECGSVFVDNVELNVHLKQEHDSVPVPVIEETPKNATDNGSADATLTAAAAQLLRFGAVAQTTNDGGSVTEPQTVTQPPANRVFNRDAYCDICQKEFCNKYYLQTHKASKHGIVPTPAAMSSSLTAQLPLSFGDTSLSMFGGAGNVSALPPHQLAPFVGRFGGMGVSQLGPIESQSPSQMPINSQQPSLAHSSSIGALLDTLANMQQMNNGNSSSSLDVAASFDFRCPICPERFANPFILQNHIASAHNRPDALSAAPPTSLMLPTTRPSTTQMNQQQQQQQPPMATLQAIYAAHLVNQLNQQRQGARVSTMEATVSQQSPLETMSLLPPTPTSAAFAATAATGTPTTPFGTNSPMNTGDLLTAGPTLLERMKQLLASGALASLPTDDGASTPRFHASFQPSTVAPSFGGNPQQAGLFGALPPGMMLNGGGGGMHLPNSTSAALPVHDTMAQVNHLPSSLMTQQSNNREAFCELCNKELCNKYFLKTHMMKKHNVLMEDSPGGSSLKRRASLISGSSSVSPTLSSTTAVTVASSMSAGYQQFGNTALLPISLAAPTSAASNNVVFSLANQPLTINRENVPVSKSPFAFQDGFLSKQQQSSVIVANTQSAVVDFANAGPQAEPLPTKAMKLEPPTTQFPPQPRSTDLPSTLAFGGGKLSLDAMMSLAAAAVTSPPTSSLSSTSVSLTCHTCSRSFPSAFSLVAHQYRDHGEMSVAAGGGVPLSTGTSVMASNGVAQQQTPQKTPIKTPFPQASPYENRSPTLQGIDPDAYCEICKKEFCSKYFLKTHKANIHGIRSADNSMLANGSPGQALMATVGSVANGMNSSMVVPPNGGYSPQRPRYLMTGRNFCDLCNKELCNKYFLRTHMLKMHGVVIDENKTVIGNINTVDRERMGGLVFRCDICHKELTTRNDLRQHKESEHGVSPAPRLNSKTSLSMVETKTTDDRRQHELNSFGSQQHNGFPPPNVTVSATHTPTTIGRPGSDPQLSLAKVCPACDGRFDSLAQLKRHLQIDHVGEISAEYLQSFQRAADEIQNSEGCNAGMDEWISCDFCDERLENIVALQHHVAMKHAEQMGIQPNSDYQMNNETPNSEVNMAVFGNERVAQLPLPKVEPEIDEEEVRAYRCSYCQYTTKWLSNLSVHERRHAAAAGVLSKDKRFACPTCLRVYRYSHSLERHRKQAHCVQYERRFDGFGAPANGDALVGRVSEPRRRVRCTRCEQTFTSRELRRSHLYTAHKHTSPVKRFNGNRSRGADEDESVVACIQQINHRIITLNSSETNATLETTFDNEKQQEAMKTEAVESGDDLPEGYGVVPSSLAAAAYTMQAFAARPACENGLRSRFLDEMLIYLPVRKTLQSPADVLFRLAPVKHRVSDVLSV